MCLVERFDKGGDVVRAGEPFDRQRDLQVPHLEQVARLDPVLSPEPVNASPPEAVGERFGLGANQVERPVDGRGVEAVAKGDCVGDKFGNNVGIVRAAGAERTSCARQQHQPAAELAGDWQDIEPGRTTTCHQQAVARVEALVDVLRPTVS